MNLKKIVQTSALTLLTLPTTVFAAGDPFEQQAIRPCGLYWKWICFLLLLLVIFLFIACFSDIVRDWVQDHFLTLLCGVFLFALASFLFSLLYDFLKDLFFYPHPSISAILF